MKRILRSYLFVIPTLLFISLPGCFFEKVGEEDPGVPEERRKLPRELTSDETTIVDGAGSFGFDLMHELIDEKPEVNHFVSPLSIFMAYGMTMNGAEGETYSQMQEAFGLGDMGREEINAAASDFMDLLIQFDEKVRFQIANSIWYRDTFEVQDAFLEINSQYYNASIEPTDFDDPETVNKINGWVNEETEGLIKKIVNGPIDPLTMLYLINAIYFNGDWSVQFDPEKTRKQTFSRPGGSTVETDMMRMEQQEHMLYKRGEDYQAVNLYYGDAGFAMTLVMPDEEVELKNWMTDINWNGWQELTEGFNEVTLTLEMPKFEQEYEIEKFKEVLKDMGIVNAFNDTLSDFSRINPDRDDLHISDTRHKTFIRVDEEGTEAAAVTSVEIGVTSAPQMVEIIFNRPFFYVIREVESGTILFMGTMNDPTSREMEPDPAF